MKVSDPGDRCVGRPALRSLGSEWRAGCFAAAVATMMGALEEREREEHTRLIWLTRRSRD